MRASAWPCCLLPLALALLLLGQQASGRQRGVSINLKARWNATSYMAEAAEFLADEDPALFWKFLDLVGSGEPSKGVEQHQCWGHIVAQASSLTSAAVGQVLPLVLASRQYSPRLELFRQLRLQAHPNEVGCCLVDVGGRAASGEAEVQSMLAAAPSEGQQQAQLVDVDHVYGPAGQGGPPASPPANASIAVLYGPLGAACTSRLHSLLSAWAVDPSVSPTVPQRYYVYRPVLSDACAASGAAGACGAVGSEGALALPGFGIEAVLKNMEYSAMDDKKKIKAEEEEGAEGADLGLVKGFDFDTLVSRKPHLRQELLTLKDHLMASDDEETVKVWDLKDLGLQAAQRVIQASDPLALLTEISQNFPALVSSLSRQKVDSALRSAVSHNQQYLSPGSNFMLINGLAFDVKDFDLYALLDRLRIEARLQDVLASTLGLGQQAVQALLSTRGDAAGDDDLSDARLDLGTGIFRHVTFFNNLERDDMYSRFSSSIADILNTYPGRLRPMGVNAFTLVMVLDPFSPEGRTLASTAYKLYSDYSPIRFGLAMAVPEVMARVQQQQRGARPLVPGWEDMSGSEKLARSLLTIKAAFGGQTAFMLWVTVARSEIEEDAAPDWIESVLRQAFIDNWAQAAKAPGQGPKARMAAKKTGAQAWEQVVAGSGYAAEVGMELQEASQWLLSKGLARPSSSPPLPLVWLNGQLTPLQEVEPGVTDQELMYRVAMEQQRLQEAVYFGKVVDDDEESILDQVLAMHPTVTRYNPSIMDPASEDTASSSAPRSITLGQLAQHPAHALLPSLSFFQKIKASAATGFTPRVHAVTHLVAGDLATAEGRSLIVETLRFISELPVSKLSRVVIVPNPANPKAAPALGELLLLAAGDLQGVERQDVATFLFKALRDPSLSELLSAPPPSAAALPASLASTLRDIATQAGLDAAAVEEALLARLKPSPAAVQARQALSSLCSNVLRVAPGDAAVVSNGRVVPVHSASQQVSQDLIAEDLQLLQMQQAQFAMGSALAAEVQGMLAAGTLPDTAAGAASEGQQQSRQQQQLDDIVMLAAAELQGAEYPESRMAPGTSKQLMQAFEKLKGKATVEIPATAATEHGQAGNDSSVHVALVLNPLTRAAQRVSQVLHLLRTTMGVSVTLYLNPQRDLSDLPLKAFYRYALPDFAEGPSSLPGAPVAYLSHLPTKRVLTINMDVPEAWLVEPTQSPYDLDNLRLIDLPESVAYAEYELEALMLTGSCIDVTQGKNRGTPPRGLQLHLGTPSTPHMVDTLVMSNLAYFQLKAAPGSWLLSLAPGRTRQLYTMEGAADAAGTETALATQAAAAEFTTHVTISSLSGKHMVLRVRKRPGMEKQDVLQAGPGEEREDDSDDEDDGDDDEEKYAAALRGSTGSTGNSTINVFTVASGHMYERLQKIMMLSVVKNTKRRVKFWIIKNYMSPHHRTVLPELAAHFGFDYEFVTYKWPHWLHKQTEKQRIIWAYKILFLDVLFPLGVDRIIFVDSDQVIRTDLGELYDMDIKGAPYAYTPFCDNNKEVDEFRFWKGGFWRDHLQGKPYHISALYLVDLKRFRALAAGDQLRIVYDQLSKDPNSLANLDQDLPNYAQHNIPIFSLPQEWLWCESWCGNQTKAKARTIDLCNNPKTKEPKLQAARRILPEWEGLDAEQAELTSRVDARLAAEAAGDEPGGQATGAAGTEDEGAGAEAAGAEGAGTGAEAGAQHDEL